MGNVNGKLQNEKKKNDLYMQVASLASEASNLRHSKQMELKSTIIAATVLDFPP